MASEKKRGTTSSVTNQLVAELMSNPDLTAMLRQHLTAQAPPQATSSGADQPGAKRKPRGQRRGRKAPRLTTPPPPPTDLSSEDDNSEEDQQESDSSSSSDEDIHEGDTTLSFFNANDIVISDKLKNKIWNREFTDLSKLFFGASSNSTKTTIQSKASTITSVQTAPTKSITNILTWTRAFQLYASIYCQRYPEEASSMFQYMSLVQSIALKNHMWTSYDTKFRSIRASTNLPWHKLHTETYLSINLSAAPPLQPTQRNVRVQSQARPLKTSNSPFREGFCWDFQRINKCSRTRCTLKHKCSYCGQSHGALSCQKNRDRQFQTLPNTQARHQQNKPRPQT